ncbi:hypothetical protein PTQ16_23100, partial [Escherichia coli]|uniref:hypothetical protein n=2 Tax=Escherichia coli TaxID=562 RepID=UPI00235FA4A3
TTTAMSINFIGMTARTMNSNGSPGKPQIPVDYQKLLLIEDIILKVFCFQNFRDGSVYMTIYKYQPFLTVNNVRHNKILIKMLGSKYSPALN